jgi:hypothetical protein
MFRYSNGGRAARGGNLSWSARGGTGRWRGQTVGKSRLSRQRYRCDRGPMPRYLVESYLIDSSAAVEDSRERARSVGDEGAGIRYVRTTFVPGDEVVLHMFEAPSPEALSKAGRIAALSYDRIVEAVEAETQGGST